MSKARFYNFEDNNFNEIGESNANIAVKNTDEYIEDNEDESEFLQDVPYSSSSIDRSSMGSIPWADDAIKQNQLDWERIERMLSGEESLPEETDLRNEILEWQEKFPQLLSKKAGIDGSEKTFDHNQSDKGYKNTLPKDLISHLSLNSSDDDDQYDDMATPTGEGHDMLENVPNLRAIRKNNVNISNANELSAKMSLLRITALPIRFTHRSATATNTVRQQSSRERNYSAAINSMGLEKKSPNIPQQLKHWPRLSQYEGSSKLIEGQHRFHMPPILNILESKKRFRDLASNKSFVQLTQVKSPQIKSAANIPNSNEINSLMGLQKQSYPPSHFNGQQQKSAWQRPLLATRINNNFFNNRNTIILPSMNAQRFSAQQKRQSTTTGTGAGADPNSLLNSTVSSLASSSSANLNLRPHYIANRFVSRWQQQINANHHTSTSTGTISTGRSISASIRSHPRATAADNEYGEFYVPSYIGYQHSGLK